jgi:hypothetical protein
MATVGEARAKAAGAQEAVLGSLSESGNALAAIPVLTLDAAGVIAAKQAVATAQAATEVTLEALSAALDQLQEALDPQPVEPSLLSVTAPVTKIMEGHSGVKVIQFLVHRGEPFAHACSATWKKAGILMASDMVEGQTREGKVVWEAGESDPIVVEFGVKGDTEKEIDNPIWLEFSDFDGCKFDPAKPAPVVVVVNDDPAAPDPGPASEPQPDLSAQARALRAKFPPFEGKTYYAAPSGSDGLSTERGSPGNAVATIAKAPAGSTIVLLGPGPFPYLNIARAGDVHLNIVADTPVYKDLVDMHDPALLGVSQLPGIKDKIMAGRQPAASPRLRGVLLRSAGFVRFAGFRWQYPDQFKLRGDPDGRVRADIQGLWLERMHANQGDGVNLDVGPMLGKPGELPMVVAYKCWSESRDLLQGSDPDAPWYTPHGTLGTDKVGSAVTDYGFSCWNEAEQIHFLESAWQMKANHMASLKSRVGKTRFLGCLFAGWDRNVGVANTCLDLGQEHDSRTSDTTSYGVEVDGCTFALPMGVPFMVGNIADVRITNNTILNCRRIMGTRLDGGASPGASHGRMPGPIDFRRNKIRAISDGVAMSLYSLGTETTLHLEDNETPNGNAIIHTHAAHRKSSSNRGPSPRIKVERGPNSGFAPPKDL